MHIFQVFRLRVQRSANYTLFEDQQASAAQIIERCIHSKPSLDQRNAVWRIGNTKTISDVLVFFFGKTTKTQKPTYDEDTGNFTDVEDESSPHSFVLFDQTNQTLAISKNNELAPTEKAIANKLVNVLKSSDFAQKQEVEFIIDELNDPEPFLDSLKSAYAVEKFVLKFIKPNPRDVDEYFHAPFEKLVEATDAKEGRAEVKGASLKTDVLEDLTHSAASSGDDIYALVRLKQGDRKTTRKNLKGNPVHLSSENPSEEKYLLRLIESMRQLYGKIRNG